MLAVAATCLVVALAAPTAGAASAGSSKAKASQKAKASVTKKRLARDIRSIRRRANTNRRNITALRTSLTTLGNDLRAAITGGDKSIDDKINGIVGVVTPVLQQLGAGSLALKDGLEKLAAGTTAGFATVQAGFGEVETAIREVATSQEYGNIRIFTGPGAAGPALPITFGSADIPDDGNGSPASGELPISVGPDPDAGQVPGGTLLTLRAAIRSGETDGGATGDPAGYVGGLLTMKCGLGTLTGGACDADPGAGTVPIPVGAPMCIQGPPPSIDIELPDGTTGGFPIVPIQEKAGRTEISRPDADDPNPLAGAGPGGPLPNDNDAADGCTLPADGSLVFLTVQAQFFDIPTSLTPGPTD